MSHNRRVATIAVPVRVYGGPIMRPTVGPLPSAVYWRRRAVVLGAVLLGIIVLFVSCSRQRRRRTSAARVLHLVDPDPGPGRRFVRQSTRPSSTACPAAAPSLPDPSDSESQQPGGDGTSDRRRPAHGRHRDGHQRHRGRRRHLRRRGDAGHAGPGRRPRSSAAPRSSCTSRSRTSAPVRAAATSAPTRRSSTSSRARGNTGRPTTAAPSRATTCVSSRPASNATTRSPGTAGSRTAAPAGSRRTEPAARPFQLRARLGTLISNPVVLTFVS